MPAYVCICISRAYALAAELFRSPDFIELAVATIKSYVGQFAYTYMRLPPSTDWHYGRDLRFRWLIVHENKRRGARELPWARPRAADPRVAFAPIGLSWLCKATDRFLPGLSCLDATGHPPSKKCCGCLDEIGCFLKDSFFVLPAPSVRHAPYSKCIVDNIIHLVSLWFARMFLE